MEANSYVYIIYQGIVLQYGETHVRTQISPWNFISSENSSAENVIKSTIGKVFSFFQRGYSDAALGASCSYFTYLSSQHKQNNNAGINNRYQRSGTLIQWGLVKPRPVGSRDQYRGLHEPRLNVSPRFSSIPLLSPMSCPRFE